MERKVRVLHIIKTLSLGGAEANLLNLASTFDTRRVETHIAYSFGGEIEGRFIAAGAKLFKYADRSHRIKSIHTIPIVLRLAAYIRRHRIDIVQTHNFNAHVWGLLAAKLSGAKVVEHVHDFRYTPSAELERRHGLLDQYRFIRLFRRQSDRIVVLTKEHAKYVVDHGYADGSDVMELQNGIPLGDFSADPSRSLRMQLGIDRDAAVIATSARMEPAKNIDLILAIAKRVRGLAPAAVFVIAGTGALLDLHRARARELGLEGTVHFIGFIDGIYALLAEADVFLLPSFLELHSIAILEALKMGVPVVISRGVGCNDEFIRDGENGFLCDPFDAESWIDPLSRLCNSPEMRAAVGRQGRDTCRRLFDIEQTAARFESVYAELVA